MRIAIPAAAIAAVLCTATLALAQGPQDGPEKKERGERAAPQREPGARGGQERGPRVERRERAEPRVQREQRPTAERERSSERRAVERKRVQRDRDDSADRAKRAERAKENAERSQVERRNVERRQVERRERVERAREKQSTERRQMERREAEQRQGDRPDRVQRSKDRKDRADRVRERGDDRVQQRADRGGRAERREAVREARARLTQEQRTRFHSSFDRRRVTNVNFRARIGTRIPRSVRLYAIPAAVVGIVPAYSYYRYVYVDDTICIIDPDTYEVVDVIEYGPEGPGGPAVVEARLALSGDERALILDAIGPDFPEAGIDLRLALGAEVPGRVELHRFPDVVLDRIPKVRDYSFAVSDGDVVIVDPRNREIELVVRR